MNILAVIKGLNKLLKEKEKEQEEPVPQKEVDEELVIKDESISESPKTSPIQGAGVSSFLELSDSALKFWLSVIQSFDVPKPVDKQQTVELPTDSVVEEVEVTSPPDKEVEVDEDTSFEASKSYSDFEGGWTVAWLVLLGLIAKFALRLGKIDGKTTIVTDNLDGVLDALSRIPDDLKDRSLSASQITGVEYKEGTIFERLGVEGHKVTSWYGVNRSWAGREHKGIDVAMEVGTPVQAPFDGIVYYVAYDRPEAGTYVEIVSEDGSTGIRLLHLSEVLVSPGDRISRGQVIAKSGNTFGNAKRPDGSSWSSGAHLHIETLWINKSIKVGSTIRGRGNHFNPLLLGASTTSDYMEGSESTPQVRVSFPTETKIGTQGKNIFSITTSTSNPWEGQVGVVKGRNGLRFPVFKDYAYSTRAAAINLAKYQTKHDVSGSGGAWTTIADIANNAKSHSYVSTKNGDRINEWIDTVSKRSGFSKDERIDLRDVDTLSRVLRGIAFQEHSADVNQSDIATVIRHFNVIDTLLSNKQ